MQFFFFSNWKHNVLIEESWCPFHLLFLAFSTNLCRITALNSCVYIMSNSIEHLVIIASICLPIFFFVVFKNCITVCYCCSRLLYDVGFFFLQWTAVYICCFIIDCSRLLCNNCTFSQRLIIFRVFLCAYFFWYRCFVRRSIIAKTKYIFKVVFSVIEKILFLIFSSFKNTIATRYPYHISNNLFEVEKHDQLKFL